MINLHDNIKIKRNRNKKDSKEINQLYLRCFILILALVLL